MLKIPDNIYSFDLILFLSPNRFEEEDKKAIILLKKICLAKLTDFCSSDLIADLKLTSKEKDEILKNQWIESSNYEIKARCNDVLRRFETKDKRPITAKASDCYYEVYKQSTGIEYLIRAITVRDIKVLNDSIFLKKIKTQIQEAINPFWLDKLFSALLISYNISQLKDTIPLINKLRNKTYEKNDLHKERAYIKVLLTLKSINKNEYHKQMAISYENEADNLFNQKNANNIFPGLPDIYQDAYNEIHQIKPLEPEILTRIKNKLINEKHSFLDIIKSRNKNKNGDP